MGQQLPGTLVGHPGPPGPSWGIPYFRVPSWGTLDCTDRHGASHIMGTLLRHPIFQGPFLGHHGQQ